MLNLAKTDYIISHNPMNKIISLLAVALLALAPSILSAQDGDKIFIGRVTQVTETEITIKWEGGGEKTFPFDDKVVCRGVKHPMDIEEGSTVAIRTNLDASETLVINAEYGK